MQHNISTTSDTTSNIHGFTTSALRLILTASNLTTDITTNLMADLTTELECYSKNNERQDTH